ncbi:helix-turn-helix domain-containing protein [Cellulomonas sp. PhB143]|uniref:helix-turn-helix domain-containing protein n=1 Tax=Cellulomonas sp. PhB143 TaxID=2485186 RepID=UPI000F4874F2|nr:helix-turn-helix domain-containing protein [Cellulomonas sp. PhB143]ROS79146.1 sugar-specific transcriptional regulator TrmB [Cellulomonas sp. PhB143]
MLGGIGIERVEEEAYRLLLNRGELTVAALAGASGIGERAARSRLDRLVADGLATARGRPRTYRPLDPHAALPALVRARQAALERVGSVVEVYAAEYRERLLVSDPGRLVEVIEGPAAINEVVETLMAAAESEVLAFDTPPYVTPDPDDAAAEEALLDRGVAVRAAYAAEVVGSPERVAVTAALVRRGERARVVPEVPLKMIVVDRRVAVVPLTAGPEGARSTAIVVRQSRLCDALVELFEAVWARGTPLFAAPASAGPEGLDESLRGLLPLLAAGLKDEAIARQLGLSERTVRRRVADLVARLGATSRFQAGVQAVRRGWLPEE